MPKQRCKSRSYRKTEEPKLQGLILTLIRQLEKLLHSQIATTSKFSLLRQFIQRPAEETWEYKKLEAPFETDLFCKMREKFGDIKALEPIFRFAWNASSELGRWCADQVWAQALTDEVIPKLEGIISKGANDLPGSSQEAQRDVQRIREACEIVKGHSFKHPRDSGQLSSKAEMLMSILQHHFGDGKDRKCIIFTERRHTAKTLLRLCETLSIPNVRPGVLVGVRNSDLTGTTTFRNQFLVLIKFRKGELNCLVCYRVNCNFWGML